MKNSDKKKWTCDICGEEIWVESDYKRIGCCNGRECGCMGLHINPVFCDKCYGKINGNEVTE